MDRRAFLSLAGAAAAGASAGGALSSPARAMPAPPRLRRLALVNAHTGETFSGPYRDDGGPISAAMQDLSLFLRDFHCGESIAIDIGVVDFLGNVLDAVGAARATVLSGYRTPATNALLARTMFGVAEHSQHIYGRALDFCVPTRLEDAMRAARAMRQGGVGWYPHSGFIHIDTGPVRNWALDGAGFAPLLLDGRSPVLHEAIAISPSGKLVASRTGRPVSVSDRLAIHRLLEKATR
jgi:uncharacterized protein YcbK (DUF882 family)